MLAQTMGRNVILPDQESMVNGIGIAYKFLAGKLRSQGVAIPDPPFRTRELLYCKVMKICGFTCIFCVLLFTCHKEAPPCSNHECIH